MPLDSRGIMTFKRMQPYVPGQANLNPAKRVKRLKELLNEKHPHICIVRGEGLGDVLMTTPVIHSIRQLFNNKVTITYATNTTYLNGVLLKVLDNNPEVNSIISRDDINESDYDVVINLHCPALRHERKGAIPINRVDLFADHAGVKLQDPIPRLYLTDDEISWGKEYLINKKVISPFIDKSTQQPILLVNLFASSSPRCIDSLRMKQSLNTLGNKGIKIGIITHQSDKMSDVMWENIVNSFRVNDLDVRQLGSVMLHCDAFLGPDSGLMQVAGALGIPSVGVFGPIPPEARINHFPNATGIWHGNRLASGCKCYFDACDTGYMCMKMIASEDIVDACVSKINEHKIVDLNALKERLQNAGNIESSLNVLTGTEVI